MDKQPDNVGQDSIFKKITKKKSTSLIAILAVVLVVVLILIGLGVIKVPSTPISTILQKKPIVELKTEYKNPFDKEAQYVNPFEKYKNPFVVNR